MILSEQDRACHSERSEESPSPPRFFAALRMTDQMWSGRFKGKIFYLLYCSIF